MKRYGVNVLTLRMSLWLSASVSSSTPTLQSKYGTNMRHANLEQKPDKIFETYGICRNFKRKFEAPPCVITVTITISDVVVSIACLASETVFRIASANDIAPRRPAKNSMC